MMSFFLKYPPGGKNVLKFDNFHVKNAVLRYAFTTYSKINLLVIGRLFKSHHL